MFTLLEEEHKNLMKQLNIENFTLSRIPRPEDLPLSSRPKSKDAKKEGDASAAIKK
jgi:hypothetical protein